VDAALDNYRKSAAIRESIAGGSPTVRSRLAGTYGYMATILATQGNVSQAIALQNKSLEIMTRLSEDDPTNASYRQHRDEAYYWLGFFLERDGDSSQALLDYRQALADFDALASADPKEVLAKEYEGMCSWALELLWRPEPTLSEDCRTFAEGSPSLRN
jgi:tetratricopeptide (TPR) repeat protein